MMSEKAKRKEKPMNIRPYWLIFGLLALILLIPFRLMNYWLLTNCIYITLSIVLGIVLLRFISLYRWKHWIVLLMLLVVLLPVLQVYNNRAWINCTYNTNEGILRAVSCSEGCDTEQHMLALGDLPISIQTYFGRYIPYCLY